MQAVLHAPRGLAPFRHFGIDDPLRSRSESRDGEFMEMLAAYRVVGGLATGAEIAARRPDVGISQLARWIAEREVLAFEWHENLWLPVFQFERAALAMREAPRSVIRELSGVLDGWELARWFVAPNAWLSDRSPIDVIEEDFSQVFDAARAHRFACAG